MAKAMFKRGYDAVNEEKERQDKARENAGNRLWNFFLREDGEEATIRFLTEEPITFDAHVIKDGKKFETIVCTKEDCALCDDGDKPSFRGAYLIIDKREVEVTDKKTNKKIKRKAQLRLYIAGTRILSQLDRYSAKYGLTKRDYTVARAGSDQNTTYSFDPEEPSKISKEEILNLMPEKMREKFDGSLNSLMNIVEEQLAMMVSDEPSSPVHEDEDDEPVVNRRNTLVSVEDEEEEVKPVERKAPPKIKGMFKTKS